MDIEGQEFSDAKLEIVGRHVEELSQRVWIRRVDGTLVEYDKAAKSEKSSTKLFSGHTDRIFLEPGLHTIRMSASSGRTLEIQADIKPGENYVFYSSEENVLKWNNNTYGVTDGRTMMVRVES